VIKMSREKVRQELIHAIDLVDDVINPLLIPNKGIKLAYAISGARTPADIGCCFLPQKKQMEDLFDTNVIFDSRCTIVRTILTALRFSPEIRCACEIRYSESLVPVCESMLLELCICDEEKIPPGVSTMDWAVAFCSEYENSVPDVICIKNKKFRTGYARLFGENPIQVTTNLLKISKRIIDATH